MAQIKVFKGTRPSEGARALREALVELGDNSLVLRGEGSTYRGREAHTIVNWGVSDSQELDRLKGAATVLNNPEAVARAINKRTCLEILVEGGVSVVPFFTTWPEARRYVEDAGGRIYVRTKLTGHSGEGIELVLRADDPQLNREAQRNVGFPITVLNEDAITQATQRATLFTAGHIGKRVEWRVHVFRGQAILLQKKLRRNPDGDDANANTLVRNVSTGWVYSVNFERTPTGLTESDVEDEAIKAIAALGLDFGAVDIIVDNATSTPRVLEVNTAPGLDGGSTIKAYADAIHGFAGGVL